MTDPLHSIGHGSKPPLRIASALIQRMREGYSARDLRADIMAGCVVGVVALPLAMALAIASGVAPQHGLYTAIVAGALIAVLGGARTNVSGPTAAFVVVLSPIATRFGLSGLLLAGGLAGLLLIVMGLARLGRLIQFIPHPVTTGFTAGIAVVIATLQLKDFLGLTPAGNPEHYTERVAALVAALPTCHGPDACLGAATLVLLLLWPRLTRAVPAPLVALAAGGVAAWALATWAPQWTVATIGSRFSYESGGVLLPGIPRIAPHFVFPWSLPGPDGFAVPLTFGLIRELMGPALAIAMLGAIESLLCAVVADGMAASRHDPDAELIAQGVGNVVAPFFGGVAATGAIARTATNIRAGARSPIAALVHAAFVLLAVLVLAPWLSWLPMASLAALLLLVAWNMSEVRHFARIVRIAPKSDTTVLLTCFTLTVMFDMVVAVSVGIVLAALLFMRRMAEIAHVRLADGGHRLHENVPADVILYEIAGPLFFGAAEKAVSALQRSQGRARAVILDLQDVPAMDVTGFVALESAIERLQQLGIFVVIAGLRHQPARVLAKGGVRAAPGRLAIAPTVREALDLVGPAGTSLAAPAR